MHEVQACVYAYAYKFGFLIFENWTGSIASVDVNYTTQSRVTLIHCITHQSLVNLNLVAGVVLAMFALPG